MDFCISVFFSLSELFHIEVNSICILASKVVRNDNVHKTNMMIRQLGTTPRDSVERETREPRE